MNVVPTVWIPYPRPAASVELRSGVLYSGCQCVRKNGLQQDCPRSECQGRSSCLNYPAPTCVPSGNAPKPYSSPCELRADAQANYPGRNQARNQYYEYKRQLDQQYLQMARQGYKEQPAVHPRHDIPCRVHRRE